MHPAKLIELKSKFIEKIREFFNTQGFIEVFTNLLSDEVIPEATIEYFELLHKEKKLYLLPSTEINLKRILAKGVSAVYQISNVFRKNEISPLHMQEFLMLEFYKKQINYLSLIELLEDLIVYLIGCFSSEYNLPLIKKPFKRVKYDDLYQEFTQKKLDETTLLSENEFSNLDETFTLVIEPEIKRRSQNDAIFIIDFPWITMPYAKKKDNLFVERVELYLNGIEVANGWTEVTDYNELLNSMDFENRKRLQLGFDFKEIPRKFLSDIKEIKEEYSGMAVGIDRLFMALFGFRDIKLVKVF